MPATTRRRFRLIAATVAVAAEEAPNATIRSAAAAVAAAGAHIRFVPVDSAGHTVDSAHPLP